MRQDGFEFVIYTNDHEPMHVHAYKGDGEAKIELSSVVVVGVWEMKKSDARKAKHIVAENQDDLIQQWREIHG
ncbi:MAG: DUF4160 domain-containing protein [Blastocatellia bacterium]